MHKAVCWHDSDTVRRAVPVSGTYARKESTQKIENRTVKTNRQSGVSMQSVRKENVKMSARVRMAKRMRNRGQALKVWIRESNRDRKYEHGGRVGNGATAVGVLFSKPIPDRSVLAGNTGPAKHVLASALVITRQDETTFPGSAPCRTSDNTCDVTSCH